MQISPEYCPTLAGAVVSALTLSMLNFGVVGPARKKAGLEYPAAYFDEADAKKDRGVANMFETYPQLLLLGLVGGSSYPRVAGALFLLWSVGAVAFVKGYATGDPKRRYTYMGGLGGLTRLALLGSLLIAGKALVDVGF